MVQAPHWFLVLKITLQFIVLRSRNRKNQKQSAATGIIYGLALGHGDKFSHHGTYDGNVTYHEESDAFPTHGGCAVPRAILDAIQVVHLCTP